MRVGRILIVGGALVCGLAGLFAFGPSSTQAEGASPVAAVGGLHPRYIGTSFRESVFGGWDLHVELEWTCAKGYTGVEAASGTVRLWDCDERGVSLEFPFAIDDQVMPGSPLVQHIPVDVEAGGDVYVWLRHADAGGVRSACDPDEVAWMPMVADQDEIPVAATDANRWVPHAR